MSYRAKKAYQGKDIVSKYDEERFRTLKGFLTNKMELRLICNALKFANITTPATILDIPCGTGRLSIHLAQKGFKIRAMDISPKMVSYTKEKINSLNLTNGVMIEVGNAESLPYPDNILDVCISLRLFGHTPPKARKKILQELKQTTTKYLILAYYHKNCLQNFLRKKQRDRRGIEWYPVTYKEIEKELEVTGLEKVKYFPLLTGISETVVVLAKKV